MFSLIRQGLFFLFSKVFVLAWGLLRTMIRVAGARNERLLCSLSLFSSRHPRDFNQVNHNPEGKSCTCVIHIRRKTAVRAVFSQGSRPACTSPFLCALYLVTGARAACFLYRRHSITYMYLLPGASYICCHPIHICR